MNVVNKILKLILPASILCLLVFIPLYPKLPLIDVKNTWVYVRVEDFLVLFVLLIWLYLFIKQKVSLKTPLTLPILIFWIVGAIATVHGVIIIFPSIAGVYPNVALLAYLRHVEYLSVFFVAFSAVKSKKFVLASIWAIVGTLIGVIAYGFGQRYLSFPAYLTMNEEYAKGIPILVSPLNRISSTFAGHYDLAAYLVLVVPILVSLIFGFKNIFVKIILGIISLLGIVLLFMTVSRVSFFALFVAIFIALLFNKRKLVIIFTPLIILAGLFFLYSHSSLLSRFNNTVKEIDVLVDAKTGGAIGQVNIEPRSYFVGKTIVHEKELINELKSASLSAQNLFIEPDVPLALTKFRIQYEIAVVQAKISSTGEVLPQGSEYINLPLAPVIKRFDNFFYEYPPNQSTPTASLDIVQGSFLVKRASAYDLSFTTRFQGEWPNTLVAFFRNLFFGSGYGSVSLAVDNNYLRMLGETGMLGTVAFVLVFIVAGAYIRKTIVETDDSMTRSLALGFVAGVVGLSINATLIDVFEASKVAFVLWLLMGIVVGALSLQYAKRFNFYQELKRIAGSFYAVVAYLVLLTVAVFSTTINSYFIGDDFTWLRWAADCKHYLTTCASIPGTITTYFINSAGFFYRPGTKSYFLFMYHLFSLNQVIYHLISVGLHLLVVVMLYILARKIFKNNFMAAAAAILFLLLSGYLEIVLWISATGHLFNAVFILLGLLTFIRWYETKSKIFLGLSILFSFISLAFYELGIVTPLLCIAYMMSMREIYGFRSWYTIIKQKLILLLFVPDLVYLVVRLISHTYWFAGDYSYNLLKLPFNAVGNILGYTLISSVGPMSYPFYEKLRDVTRANIFIAVILALILIAVVFVVGKRLVKNLSNDEKRIAIFSALFAVITLLPFLGLGNITFRYSYLASFGIVMILVMLSGKLYRFLTSLGRDIAIGIMAFVGSVFILVHVVQAQQAMIEWHGAGDIVQNFLISLDSLYDESWSTNKVNLYFANVPVHSHDAWVFPVGLQDAVWFVSKNEDVNVVTVPDTSSVPLSVYLSKTSWVFQFQPDGSLKRVLPSKNNKK